MNANEKHAVRRFTINDIHVGARFYEVLVKHAAEHPGAPIRYDVLLATCREAHSMWARPATLLVALALMLCNVTHSIEGSP